MGKFGDFHHYCYRRLRSGVRVDLKRGRGGKWECGRSFLAAADVAAAVADSLLKRMKAYYPDDTRSVLTLIDCYCSCMTNERPRDEGKRSLLMLL